MIVIITIDLYDEAADRQHDTGMTEATYLAVVSALAPYGEIEEIERTGDR